MLRRTATHQNLIILVIFGTGISINFSITNCWKRKFRFWKKYQNPLFISMLLSMKKINCNQYDGFQLRRGYFLLHVLYCKGGEKGVYWRKCWDRYCMRCIHVHVVKSFLITFIEWISIFYCIWFWVCTWNNISMWKLSYHLSTSCLFKLSWYYS